MTDPSRDRDPLTAASAHASCMTRLAEVVQRLSLAHDFAGIIEIVRRAARDLTGADGATFVLREGDQCFYADEDAIGPLWKGLRFPLEACISGWVMLHRQPVVIEDIALDDRIPIEAYRPTFVRSLAMVPIRSRAPLGAIGAYWARPFRASDQQLAVLQALADSSAVAIEHVQLRAMLDERVAQRTAQLEAVNQRLLKEIEVRQAVEDEVRRLSLTDDLTGLYNRRGFTLFAQRDFDVARRDGQPLLILMADLDGLKLVNDRRGHAAGDRLIMRAAQVLRSAFRDTDIVARMGGDEFTVLASGWDEPPQALLQRLDEAISREKPPREKALAMSVGIVRADPGEDVSLESLLQRADEVMYRMKRARRARASRPA